MTTTSADAMPGQEATEHDALQFDHVIAGAGAAAPADKVAVVCAACRASIETEYFHVNGNCVCGRCRSLAESVAETPRAMTPFVKAAAYGLGAGVAGAVVYYAVMAIAHLEIGIVAVLIGYMVGYAIRRAIGGRGGLRFQVLAVCLTYGSIALAYAPIAIQGAVDAGRAARSAKTASASGKTTAAADGDSASAAKPSGGKLLLGVAVLAGFVAVLPVLVVVGSLPSGLISAFIIFIGMRQAWKMTGTPRVEILGPFRVGAVPATTSA